MEGTRKLFIKYVTLNVLGMIGLSCYILADTFFVANGLGADGLTALTLAIPVFSLINGTGLMLGMGGAVRFSINGRKGRSKEKDEIFSQAVLFTILISVLFLLTGIAASGVLAQLLGADESTFAMVKTYVRTILLFAPMFMLNNVMICFVRNDGNPNLSMLAMVLGSGSNIVLDYLFVFPFQMGMFGAALATGIAPVVSLCVLSTHMIRKRNQFGFRKIRLKLAALGDYVSLGISSFITEVSSGMVIVIFNIVILNLSGNIGVAAYGVIANLALVILAIFNGTGQGIQPLISSSYGKGNENEVRMVFRYAVITVAAGAAVIYAGTFLGAESLVAAFNRDDDAELARMAVSGLKLYFPAFFCAGINIVSAVYYSSTDQPMKSFLVSIFRGFLFVVPLTFLMPAVLGMKGVWLAVPAAELLTLLVVMVMHRKRRQ